MMTREDADNMLLGYTFEKFLVKKGFAQWVGDVGGAIRLNKFIKYPSVRKKYNIEKEKMRKYLGLLVQGKTHTTHFRLLADTVLFL